MAEAGGRRVSPVALTCPRRLCEQGWARQNLGQHDEAIRLYEQVIAKTGSETAAKAQFMIGEISLNGNNMPRL